MTKTGFRFSTRHDRHGARHIRYDSEGGRVWCAHQQDTSPVQSVYDYESPCPFCELGFSHTEQLHRERVEDAARLRATEKLLEQTRRDLEHDIQYDESEEWIERRRWAVRQLEAEAKALTRLFQPD